MNNDNGGSMDQVTKIQTVRSHAGMARFYAECSEDVAGFVPARALPRDAYSFSATRVAFMRGDTPVVAVEVSHRVYEVYAIPAALLFSTEDAAFAAQEG